jgi:hypothetical protein
MLSGAEDEACSSRCTLVTTELPAQLRWQNAWLQKVGRSDAPAPELASGVDPFGVGVPAGGPMRDLHKALAPPRSGCCG